MRERRKEEFRNKEAVDEDRDEEDLCKEKRQRQVVYFCKSQPRCLLFLHITTFTCVLFNLLYVSFVDI